MITEKTKSQIKEILSAFYGADEIKLDEIISIDSFSTDMDFSKLDDEVLLLKWEDDEDQLFEAAFTVEGLMNAEIMQDGVGLILLDDEGDQCIIHFFRSVLKENATLAYIASERKAGIR